jgi:hypothetical protein
MPPFPVNLPYRVSIPSGQTGDRSFTGEVKYRTSGDEITVATPASTISDLLWLFTIQVEGDEVDKPDVSIGMSASATDGFDFGVDIDAAPTPPEFVSGIFLYQDFLEYRKDIRPITDEAEWFLVVMPNGNAMRFSWPAAELPEGKNLFMIEVDSLGNEVGGGTIDLMGNGEITIEESTTDRFFVIRYTSNEHITLSFAAGWNMISLSLTPVASATEGILPMSLSNSETRILRDGLRGTVTSGKVWEWRAGKFEEATELKALRGYWVYAQSPYAVTIEGTPPVTDAAEKLTVNGNGNVTVGLEKGWNLWGPASPVTITYPLTSPLQGTVWWWDAGVGRYQVTTQMQPYRAYWINATNPHIFGLEITE